MADAADKNTFWKTLQKIVKQDNIILNESPPLSQQQQQQLLQHQQSQQQQYTQIQQQSEFLSNEEFNRYIQLITTGEYASRLQNFDIIVKKFDNTGLTENYTNQILSATKDLYETNKTPTEYRRKAFELLIQLIDKKFDKLDKIIIKNLFLNLILNYNLNNENRLLDDIDLRFTLFTTITKMGQLFNNFDLNLIFDCLNLFLDNSNGKLNKHAELFEIFNNFLSKQQPLQITYIDNNLQIKLTKYLYDYLLTKNVNEDNDETKLYVRLLDVLSDKLTTSESISNTVLCLCQLIVSIKSEINDTVYNCMISLFNGSMAYTALYSIINEIFDKNKIQATRHKKLIFGALLHIKKISDVKQTKLKNTRDKDKDNRDMCFVYELFVNTLIYLPNILSVYDDLDLVRLVINLLIDLINLAYCRDTFNCLLAFNSKEFLIESTQLCFSKVVSDDKLLKYYADLLNLIEKKDVCTHKLSMTLSSSQQSLLLQTQSLTPQQQQQLINQGNFSKNQLKDNDDFVFSNSLKDQFYQIIYDFNRIDLLTDSAINNCIKHYLNEKFLPYFDNNWLSNIKSLLQKYYNSSSITVRKYCIESIGKLTDKCDILDWKSLKGDIIENILIPLCQNVNSELNFELKLFIINKLIDFSQLCQNEKQMNLIIQVFSKVVLSQYNSNDHINNINCLTKTVNSLIELFDYCLTENLTTSCIGIYATLVNFLNNCYETSNVSTPPLISATHQLVINTSNINLPSHQPSDSPIFSTLRRDIFDFLMRLRSDEHQQLYLLSKNDRKKAKVSKYLVLNMSELSDAPVKISNYEIDYRFVINLLKKCIEKETESIVLDKVFNDLPALLQNQMDLLFKDEFSEHLFKFVITKQKIFLHKVDSQKLFQIISNLIFYHFYWDKVAQEQLLQYFCAAVHNHKTHRGCLEALTVAIYEMHETNKPKAFADIVIKLSQISGLTIGAQGLLELLSNMSELPKLFESNCFGDKEYIAVAAIAIKYTDPLKFNAYIILLAHYVICIWFLKCKGEMRKAYASFACKGLQQEVIAQLEYHNRISPKDTKSPSKTNFDDSPNDLRFSNKKIHENDQSNEKDKIKNNLTENSKQFYRELVEVTTDFMSNYMYSNPTNDYYDVSTHSTSHYNRRDSIKDSNRKGLSRQWILNNCIAKISSVMLRNSDGIPFPHFRQNTDNQSVSSTSSSSSTNSTCIQTNNLSNTTMNNSCNDVLKTEQDFFDETIDNENDTIEIKSRSASISTPTNNTNGSLNFKRRYKSGVDTSTIDQNKEIKQVDYKHAKDDISLASSIECTNIINKKSEENHEICRPECWCNCLIEIKLSYPTKDVTFLVLIDRQMHDIDLSLFGPDILTQIVRPHPLFAIENRRNGSLPRISESSVLSDHTLSISDSNEFPKLNQNLVENGQESDSENNGHHQQNSIKERKTQDNTKSTTKLNRKASFDSSFKTINRSNSNESTNAPLNTNQNMSSSINTLNLSVDPPSNKHRGVTFSTQTPIYSSINNDKSQLEINQSTPEQNKTNSQHRIPSNKKNFTNIMGKIGLNTSTSNNNSPNIDPREIFLQLFKTRANDKDNIILIPDTADIQQSVNILEYHPCYMIHKIGVIYIAPNQTNDEKIILGNVGGSTRYKQFLRGLGTYIKIKDLDTSKFYPGGLERDGSAGDFGILWSDNISQVMFHVATLMPTNESNFKKKHIGNDFTIIVYNESSEEYQFSFIKGEVNSICIEIEPLKCGTNIVRVKTTNDISSQWIGHTEPQVISDTYLPLLVRKTALHADLAVKVYRAQKDNNNYGGKWWDRLKQINRIKKLCKDKLNNKDTMSTQSSTTTTTTTIPNVFPISTINNEFVYDFTENI